MICISYFSRGGCFCESCSNLRGNIFSSNPEMWLPEVLARSSAVREKLCWALVIKCLYLSPWTQMSNQEPNPGSKLTQNHVAGSSEECCRPTLIISPLSAGAARYTSVVRFTQVTNCAIKPKTFKVLLLSNTDWIYVSKQPKTKTFIQS